MTGCPLRARRSGPSRGFPSSGGSGGQQTWWRCSRLCGEVGDSAVEAPMIQNSPARANVCIRTLEHARTHLMPHVITLVVTTFLLARAGKK